MSRQMSTVTENHTKKEKLLRVACISLTSCSLTITNRTKCQFSFLSIEGVVICMFSVRFTLSMLSSSIVVASSLWW